MNPRFVLACCALCASFPAAALLTRADREDSEYRELATGYPSAIALGAGGEGVLIAPGWLLTSAKFARTLEARKDASVQVGAKARRVMRVFVHPKASTDPAPENIALLRLRDAVGDIEPVRLYRGADEAGMGMVFVGHGATGRVGRAGKPERAEDHVARGAINTVDRISPFTLSARTKEGDDASDLQGLLVPGEEGAPAYVETPEGLRLAGLYYGNVTVWTLFSRLSAFVPWVEATMVGSERDEMRGMLGEEAR